MENDAQRRKWRNMKTHKGSFVKKGIKYKIDGKKCKYILYTILKNNKNVGKNFPT